MGAKPAEYYDSVYERQIVGEIGTRIEKRLPAALEHVIGSVLDLGCGLGQVADRVGGAEYLGVDFSPVAIEYARAHVKNPTAAFVLADLREWSACAGSVYDTVLLLEVLEHVDDPQGLADIAVQLARKRVIVTVPTSFQDAAHVKLEWTRGDLADLFGELALCRVFGGYWWLAVKAEDVRPLVSLCMIVKDEQDLIAKAIDSTNGLADEVIVVDTGSTDGTVEIAERLATQVVMDGDRMHKGKSRNISLDSASGKWIVVLDADEVIADPIGLREHLKSTDAQAIYVRLAFVDAADKPTLVYPQMRIWRKGTFKYKYRAHEVPVPVDGWGEIERTDFVWEHRPPRDRSWKSGYTLNRLLLDVEENPGVARPLYYLGRQYMYRQEWDRGIETLEKYLSLQGRTDRADAWECLARCHAGRGNQVEQIHALYQACAELPGRRDWWGSLAEVYHSQGNDEMAVAVLKCALEIPVPERSYATYWWHGSHIYDLLARCLWKLGRYEEGLQYARRAVELLPESDRLRKNLQFFEDRTNGGGGRIFITGCAKSGTTLLRRLFYAFDDVEVVPEEMHVYRFVEQESDARFLVAKRHRFSVFSEHLPPEEVTKQTDFIKRYRIAIINIIRDGRDVIFSDGMAVSPRRWAAAMSQRAAYPDLIVLEFKYETLIQQPDEEQQRLIDRLGLKKLHDWSSYPAFVHDAEFANRGAAYQRRPLDSRSVGEGKDYRSVLCGIDASFEAQLQKVGYT